MLPELGKDSPIYSILRVDPQTDATTLFIEFCTAIHIPKYAHEKNETHFLLEGVKEKRRGRRHSSAPTRTVFDARSAQNLLLDLDRIEPLSHEQMGESLFADREASI